MGPDILRRATSTSPAGNYNYNSAVLKLLYRLSYTGLFCVSSYYVTDVVGIALLNGVKLNHTCVAVNDTLTA
jgi:hypothetical protein